MSEKKRKKPRNTKTDTHYVDNKKFLAAMTVYKEAYDKWNHEGADPENRPKPSEYIGECIYKIALRIGDKPNFKGYSYLDEMISDGIENCFQYLGNFDPEKSNSPFSYFTTIIHYAFIRRIDKEKKQAFIKMVAFESMDKTQTHIESLKAQGLVDPDSSNPYADYYRLSPDDVTKFSKKKPKK